MIVHLCCASSTSEYTHNGQNKLAFSNIEEKLCNHYYVSGYSSVLCIVVCELASLGFVTSKLNCFQPIQNEIIGKKVAYQQA